MHHRCVTRSIAAMVFLAFNISPADGSDRHPRPSYSNVKDIDEMAASLRVSLAGQERYSFSRSWWQWDRLRCRYVDGGRQDEHALKILRAAFRGLILDWHRKLEAQGEGDLLYLFFTTVKGDKNERVLDIENRTLLRDVHGGGYHGGWGGAARMRIYQELVRQDMLTGEEKQRFQRIVYQSLEPRFIEFSRGAQSANNHSFGNAGGIALAIKLFPKAPQAHEARAWLDRIWDDLAGFGDWTEWTYYPYGPIFLHGMLDVAEATGKIETDRELINSIGLRCLGFIHGGGVRGNPNSGARVRKDQWSVHADPWNVGYYDVETSSRDGHFWYRLAQHYKDPIFLWAAEQVALGGRPAEGDMMAEYMAAYQRRFFWFDTRDIKPRAATGRASVGFVSARKHRIPERLLLTAGRTAGKPFAAFFLYEAKDEHLDNVSGHLYEYSVKGSKFLHTSGKYNNVYSGDRLKGGGTGEESLDLLLVLHKRHDFPLHPDRKGDERDFMRRGSIKHRHDLVVASNNDAGDSFGQFGFDDYYGAGSCWIRRVVLTSEGYLVVADEYTPSRALGDDYQAGPVWHLAIDAATLSDSQDGNWFDAPALDQASWQKMPLRLVLYIHNDGVLKYGSLHQSHSQDSDPNVTTFGYRPVTGGQTARFLSVFVPYETHERHREVISRLKTVITESGSFVALIDKTTVRIQRHGGWSVSRAR